MPELPPQSPARVGDAPDAAPARLMSRKSQLVADMAATVRVRWVPTVSDCRNTRRTADAPAQVRVPEIVQAPLKEIDEIPLALEGEVAVKLLKLVPAGMFHPYAPVLINDTL